MFQPGNRVEVITACRLLKGGARGTVHDVTKLDTTRGSRYVLTIDWDGDSPHRYYVMAERVRKITPLEQLAEAGEIF